MRKDLCIISAPSLKSLVWWCTLVIVVLRPCRWIPGICWPTSLAYLIKHLCKGEDLSWSHWDPCNTGYPCAAVVRLNADKLSVTWLCSSWWHFTILEILDIWSFTDAEMKCGVIFTVWNRALMSCLFSSTTWINVEKYFDLFQTCFFKIGFSDGIYFPFYRTIEDTLVSKLFC